MAEMDVTTSVASDLKNAITEYSVDEQHTEGATDQKETTWMDTDFGQNLGYYNDIPEVESVIDVKALWVMGRGYIADETTTMILDTIKGNGFDTFNSILENLERTKDIGGNSYGEIITNEKGILINLKPLDPEVMRHVANPEGIIIRFEQTAKVGKGKPVGEVVREFKPEDIFYLARNRVADEIHGNTMIKRLANIILAKNEAMEIQKQINQRFAKPRWIIKLTTDIPSEIATEKAKWDKANAGGENMYVPMGSVEVEQMAISPNATINLQTNIDNLDAKFYESANCPKIIVGGSGGFTDAAVKTAYLAFEQNIRARQLYVEEQVLNQLNLVINLEMAASLSNDMLSDEAKDGTLNQQLNKPSGAAPTPVGAV